MAKTCIIIGNGLAGALQAVLLARDGWRVRVYERRGDPRAAGYAGGRSINLALSARGLAGLRAAGLEGMVRERDIIPMPGRMIHPEGGGCTFQPYSKDATDAINSVSRGGLNLTLITAAAACPGVEFVFDHPCVDADLAAGEAMFRGPDGGLVRAGADLIIGADGAYSALRGAMQKTDRYEYSQSYLEHGYKELHIPAKPGAEGPARYMMEPHALHIWPRGGAMMIALPNRDGTFTCTLFWPYEGEHSFAGLDASDGRSVRAFFERNYADAAGLMPTLESDFARNPVGSLVTVRCSPWHAGGRFVLVGDAAHAIVPFYGQGINCGFEDCVELAGCLRRHADQHEALKAYQAARKPNADAIAGMALDNFIEMRDSVGRPEFLYRKRVEQTLHAAFPERVEPQYNLVSFSTVPYTEARARGAALARIIDEVIKRVPMSRAEEPGWAGAVREAGSEPFKTAGDEPAGAARHGGGADERTVYDMSPPVTERLAVWPGDTPPRREVLCELARGATVTLSTIRSTVHLGSHADGPNHYGVGAPSIGEMGLHHYIGPCQVVRARVARGGRVGVGDIVGGVDAVRSRRVLVSTGTFPDPENWNSDFAGLSVELIEVLAARGVVTIGIDSPSVDLEESKDLPAHRAILRHGIAILEGLRLAGIEPGEYELIAPPLRLMGFDASPVRAVLRR
ncbi:MAG: FAD-dependent monooxygenase [Phycisphaerae bacterium]|nr:FAD-dependent monooxygenase [Phycisphaerae bacterium]